MKVLAVSDIHIHDYTTRCPREKYRLLQSRIVAQNIIEAGKREGAEVIVFAGDIIEKSLIRSYILAEVKNFFDTIMREFQYGYLILGNHDLDSKEMNQNSTDSYLGIMLPGNLYYADGRMAQLGSSTVAFSNWKPKFDLSWIPGRVDVLFTHATIDYSGTGIIKSQSLDKSKFNLAICGDIHYPAVLGKFVSIGVPQKCKMGDSDDATGVIYDTETKTFTHVNLNPHDNLMKLRYTPDMDQDGYCEANNTYYVYKPSNVGTSSTGADAIQIPAWEEVRDLTERILTEGGLREVHSAVLQNVREGDITDIDFMFAPLRVACHNWRSIEDAEIYFEPGDKFLVKGLNGSGKSSILSAIKYALIENRSIKDFIQAGQKECWTEIEFLYQGRRSRIRRGSKQWGLWVDDVAIPYPNKNAFNEDMHVRYPFIDYTDFYFFDEDHLKLIGDITPERKAEMITRFFKLDRIDHYNQVAQDIYAKICQGARTWIDQNAFAVRDIQPVKLKIEQFILPARSREELVSLQGEALRIQGAYHAYSKYLGEISRIEGSKTTLTRDLGRLTEAIRSSRAVEVVEQELTEVRNNLEGLRQRKSEQGALQTRLEILQRDLGTCLSEGRKTQGEYDNLGKTGRCYVCGGVMDSEHMSVHKKELEDKLSGLLQQYDSLTTTINEVNSLLSGFSGLDNQIADLGEKESNLIKEKGNIESLASDYGRVSSELTNLDNQFKALEAPEKVELPENFVEITTQLQKEIGDWDTYDSLTSEFNRLRDIISTTQIEIDKNRAATELLEKYINITSPVGAIYQEIMGKLSMEFSDTLVRYEVSKYTFRGKDHLDLVPYYNNRGNWFSYQSCSAGQKTILDINFMSKINTGIGFLVMDEFLKSLDPENHDMCLDVISRMNVCCTLLSSHMETVANFNNKSIRLSLNSAGLTLVEVSSKS